MALAAPPAPPLLSAPLVHVWFGFPAALTGPREAACSQAAYAGRTWVLAFVPSFISERV